MIHPETDIASKEPMDFNSNYLPVAICGMGMRLPGGIRSDLDLYKFLVEGQDARTTVPKSRYNVEAYHNANSKPSTIISKYGYFLEDIDLGKCDLSMFNMTPAEVSRMDPAQRLLLEAVREAFETAGEADFRGKSIGTFASLFSEDWQDLQNRDVNDAGPYQLTGKADFMLANRLAYEYDLRGPSMTFKTACSSSGIALHQAVQSIRLNEISSAIVGGANLIFSPRLNIDMSATMALSPTGSSNSFDATADGYARAEGITCLYIKRLDHAIRDGNPIRAIIRGSASNADGKTSGLSVPNPAAHEALIRQAYGMSGLDFADTPVVECHGTGTVTGDPLEVSAISNCFGARDTYIGSVKPNLGHSEATSAITSILKAVVALEHQTVLPNIKFVTPNPAIPWKRIKLTVPTKPTPWPAGRCERVSINSFGFGGSNVHIILESARSFGIPSPRPMPIAGPPMAMAPTKHLLLFSANSTKALRDIVASHHEYLSKFPSQLGSLVYTLAERRERLKYKTFSVTDGHPSSISQSNQTRHSTPPRKQVTVRAAFIFTGQGAQWPQMGRDLMQYPAFGEAIDKMDAVMQSLEHAPSWTIRDILTSCTDTTTMNRAEYAQPICTALQVALVDLLAAWGVVPAAVVGHSSGEIGAAYAAGILSMREAIIAAFYRGLVCTDGQTTGGMAAVGLGREDIQPYLTPGIGIACENSAKSVTLSGDIEPLEESIASIRHDHPSILARKLQVSMAYHSHHMYKYGDAYHDLIKRHVKANTPRIPYFSTVRETLASDAGTVGDATYWKDNLTNPVLFYSAMKRLLQQVRDNVSIHLEVGPHSALVGPLRQIYKEQGASISYESCLTRGKDGIDSFLNAMGQLYCAGAHIRPPVPVSAGVLAHLPTYPWHYGEDYWSESRVMSGWRFRQHSHHELLGLRIVETSDVEPAWRNILRISDVSWLRDHCVHNDIVFPAAAYIAMAGEAASQLNKKETGIKAGYTVREVHLINAMLLRDDRTIEIVTSLRPSMLTAKEDSSWYEFSIMSYDGKSWTRHCHGLVTVGFVSFVKPTFEDRGLPRKLSSDRWYKVMARVGLNYGPRFRGLQTIRAAVSGGIASVQVSDRQFDEESSYAMHPTTLDCVLQSWTVARTNGVPRLLTRSSLPTMIEELCVSSSAASATIECVTVGDEAHASSCGKNASGEIVFCLKGLKGKPVARGDVDYARDLSVQRLHWRQDIDFANVSELITPKPDIRTQLAIVERLYVLCAAEACQQLSRTTVSQPHFARFLHWLEQQVERFKKPDYPLVNDAPELLSLSSETRKERIMDCLKEARRVESRPLAEAVWRAYSRLTGIIEGRVDYLDLLIKDGLLQQVYNWGNDRMEISPFFSLLGHTNPQLEIIEIGAGTGGLTAKILDSLRSEYGECLYFRYTFTDISSGFLIQAQNRFQGYDRIEYKILDISKDPIEQGFMPAKYDLVLASNVLHATPNLTDTLKNCRKLMKQNGRLFLQELSLVAKSMNFVMGLFSGWWLGDQDGRSDEPYIAPEEWDVRLRDAGFSGIRSLVLDGEKSCYLNANMIAEPAVKINYPRSMTLLTRSEALGPLSQAAKSILELHGYEVRHTIWSDDDMPCIGQDVISFIDVEAGDKPMLQSVGEVDFERLLSLIDTQSQSITLWLTKPAQLSCQDPHNGQILGLARTVRAELAADFATMELEHLGDGAAAAVVSVMRKLQRAREQGITATTVDALDPDMEYAWVDGSIHISRVHWISALQYYSEVTERLAPDAKHLVVGQRGMLSSLQWRGLRFGTLGEDEVCVRMVNIGMNFRDIMIALNVVLEAPEEPDGGVNAFSTEGAGYIIAVGSNVQDLRVGDRVMAMGSTSPGFATIAQRPSACCVKIPVQLTDDEAATMATAYFTVLYSLIDKAHLQRGQTVLIHSAAGGVGIAAIHVARWLGAEIYATVGDDSKAEFLMHEFGIPRERIFSSRDVGFADGVMRATNGLGVDVVLNSLAGELLHASWKCVAAHGHMVEIGVRDVVGHGKLAMSQFHDNRSFTCVGVSALMKNLPRTSRLLKQIVQLYEEGHIHPIRPITQFKAEDIESAYRYMQKARHTGKIIIKFPEEDVLPVTVPALPPPSFRGDVSYLLVGGMGGLGQAIASWMVSHGAKHLIFLSRSAGQSTQHNDFFNELREAGCSIQCYAGDVADAAIVRTMVQEARLPIAGVMQMVMVLSDMGIMDMDIASWDAAVRPKIDGTWNLHRHLPEALDFFVLFSSVAGLFGYFGQANYASANTFLDAFVQYRRGLGLAASVIDIGPVDEVGYVARTPGSLVNIVAHAELAGEQDFLNTLQLAIASSSLSVCDGQNSRRNPGQLLQVPRCKLSISDPQNTTIWKRDPRMAIYRNLEQAPNASDYVETGDPIQAFMASVKKDASKLDDEGASRTLSTALGARVAGFLSRDNNDIDLSQNLAAAGVDSLVAIELRNWWKQSFGVDVSVLQLLDGGNFEQLARLAIRQLKKKYRPSTK